MIESKAAAAPQSPVTVAEQTGGKAARKGKPSEEEIKALRDAAQARREQGKVGQQELAQEKSLRRHRDKLVKEDQRLQKVEQRNVVTQTATTKADAGVVAVVGEVTDCVSANFGAGVVSAAVCLAASSVDIDPLLIIAPTSLDASD